MKKIFVLVWLGVLLYGISWLFWQNEWKYTQPTPVPEAYRKVETGAYVDLGDKITTAPGKPLFIHFFNPGCPCSRFNIPHFRSLVKHYSDKINFAIVVMSKDKKYSAADISEKFNVDIPVLFDDGIADRCGVYSTPQAVLLDAGHRLYYRGNYNKSRYCTDKNTNYAQMAIDTLLSNHVSPVFSENALRAYGCELPNCTK